MGNCCHKSVDSESTQAQKALDQLQQIVKITESYLQALKKGRFNVSEALLILQGVDALIGLIRNGIKTNRVDAIEVPDGFMDPNPYNASEIADKQDLLHYMENCLQVLDSVAKKNIKSQEINSKKIEIKSIITFIENTVPAPRTNTDYQSPSMSI